MSTIGLAAQVEATATMRDRIEMLRRLKAAGVGLLTALTALTVLEGLLPATTAVAFATLVSRLDAVVSGDAAVAVTPLLLYLIVVLAGYALGVLREPLRYLAQTRIDGEHRARVAQLTSTSDTVGALERPEVQALIWQTRADPESFIEGTPGPGVLVQLELLGRLLAMVSAGVVLAAYAWWLVPVLVVAGLAAERLYSREAKRRRLVWRRSIAPGMHADVWANAIVSPSEGKEVRVFGLGDWAVGRIQHHLRLAFNPMWTHGRRTLASLWQPALILTVPLLAAYAGVALAAVRGAATVAVAAAVFAASTAVYQALTENPHFTVNTVHCMRAYEQLKVELAAPAPAERVAELPERPVIRFEHVGFQYAGTTRPVLDRIDLEIRPGELLGVVGLNGAGKSTLIRLLARLYEPTAGRLTADGLDLAGVPAEVWRRRLSVVFQDFVRYPLSVADNVALGNGGVPRDQAALTAAAEDAGLTGVLDRLPLGWDTPLSRSRTGGVDLSGGQWQQVVLARALYAVRTGAEILVLDEPTAHLDVRTEFEVFDRLAAHKGDATVVLISHRLSTVRQADRIVLLGDGRITESGRHDELIAHGGAYAEMFALQAERFRRGFDDRLEEGDVR
ncbi:ATP-binding cassette subfamily B protein [Hamadaea flava]|uniref:ATP-binding cassette domain-containing protein n=1 Tax=Hamadaea flava TaxID=1742688 RepID=A0ABV8LZC1_9ACTN|nr:ABC transporter ATP-binding protein [Hamadaea flava]MCP2321680.1 ATP-binding cassette subfamily B protein [Hamadaea flava]